MEPPIEDSLPRRIVLVVELVVELGREPGNSA